MVDARLFRLASNWDANTKLLARPFVRSHCSFTRSHTHSRDRWKIWFLMSQFQPFLNHSAMMATYGEVYISWNHFFSKSSNTELERFLSLSMGSPIRLPSSVVKLVIPPYYFFKMITLHRNSHNLTLISTTPKATQARNEQFGLKTETDWPTAKWRKVYGDLHQHQSHTIAWIVIRKQR